MGNVPPDPGDVLCHNFSACSAGTKLASYTYTLGNAGNRTNVLELNSRNVGYGYDNDYRLTSEAITGDPGGNNGTVSYTGYDAVGNRTRETWGQTERSPGFSSQINMENVPSVPVFPDTLYHMFLLQEDRGIPHGKEPRDRPLVMLWRSGRPGLLRQRHILHWLYASVALCVRRGCRSR